MADFGNLRALAINEDTTAEYTFDDIVIRLTEAGDEVYPSMFFAPMLESNREYWNERHRMAVEMAEQRQNETRDQRKRRLTGVEGVDEERERQKVLIARTCAKRWGENGMPDVRGEVPEFTEQNVLDFLKALPIEMFDPLVGWLSNSYNFFDRRALVTETQAEALGNS